MTLAPAQVTRMDAILATATPDAATRAVLREIVPALAITRCDAIDMREETPFRVYEKISLYLIDGRDHCWKITQDPGCATGIAFASNGGGA